MEKSYISYISPKIELEKSSIHGEGMYAKESFIKDEVIFIKGGHILKREQLFSSGVINSYLPLGDGYFLGATSQEEEDEIKLFINHSCNPNCGVRGEITFVAMRDIAKDEEITFDYAFVDDEDFSFSCNCGEPTCRSIITGRDWKIKEIQNKYFDYFAAYLKKKIRSKGDD